MMQVAQHNLIQDVSTRWNSTFYFIDRLLEQRWPITAVLSDSSVTKVRTIPWMLQQISGFLASLKPVLHVLQVAIIYLICIYISSIANCSWPH